MNTHSVALPGFLRILSRTLKPYRKLKGAFSSTGLVLAGLFTVCLLASGCSYKMASDFPSVIGDGSKTVKIKSVDNPTMSTNIAYVIRTQLRNEINARHMAKWVDSGPADFELEIKIKQFTDRGATFDDNFQTKLYSIQLVVELVVYDGSTNQKVWESGPISQVDFSEIPTSRESTLEVTTLLVRTLADRMRNQF